MFRSILNGFHGLKLRALTPNSSYYDFSTSALKRIYKTSNSTNQQSPTISFLVKSCGLSLESAISVSAKLKIEETEKVNSTLKLLKSHGLSKNDIKDLISKRPGLLLADLDNTLKPNLKIFENLGLTGSKLVQMFLKNPRILEVDAEKIVGFFRDHGFNDKQISNIARKSPTLCAANADDTLGPKLDYLKSLGFSDTQVARVIASEPYILQRSLENHLIPTINAIKRLVGEENVLKAIKGYTCILESNLEKRVEPNISVLLSRGVPNDMIVKLFVIQPKAFLLSGDRFNEIVEEVTSLGFDPTNLLYVLAIHTMAVMSKSRWEQKMEAFFSFGLSRDEIHSAFKLQPLCMIVSEKKIRKLMYFFVNKLNWKPAAIIKSPNLLLLSLEKRIIPRCSIMQILMSRQLVKRDPSLVYLFRMTEKKFQETYVNKYQHVIPEILKAHQGKIEFQGFT